MKKKTFEAGQKYLEKKKKRKMNIDENPIFQMYFNFPYKHSEIKYNLICTRSA